MNKTSFFSAGRSRRFSSLKSARPTKPSTLLQGVRGLAQNKKNPPRFVAPHCPPRLMPSRTRNAWASKQTDFQKTIQVRIHLRGSTSLGMRLCPPTDTPLGLTDLLVCPPSPDGSIPVNKSRKLQTRKCLYHITLTFTQAEAMGREMSLLNA